MERSRQWARWLSTPVPDGGHGLREGDVVMVVLSHGLDLYAAYLGALLCGVVPAMIPFPSPKHSRQAWRDSLTGLVLVCAPKAVVGFEEISADLRES